MPAKLNLIKRRFGRLVVVEENGRTKTGQVCWRCLCDCGNEWTGGMDSLRSGNTKSCGCLGDESRTKHGMHESPEYSTWEGMVQRCLNKKARNYKWYGGREIVVCDRWRDFKNFFKDMGAKPGKGFSVERRDNNKGYCAENCCWANTTTQSRNKRMPISNSSGYRGVHLNKKPGGKYRAVISVKSKYIHLGHFDTITEAAEARRLGEIKYWGKAYA